jgi:hypothetical protein
MNSDIVLPLIGALIGVTIGLMKGDLITNHLSKFFREKWQKVFRALPQNNNPSE